MPSPCPSRKNKHRRNRQPVGRQARRNPERVDEIFAIARDINLIELLPDGQTLEGIFNEPSAKWKFANKFRLFLLTSAESSRLLGDIDISDRNEAACEIKGRIGKLALKHDGNFGETALVRLAWRSSNRESLVGMGFDAGLQQKLTEDRRILLEGFTDPSATAKNFCVNIVYAYRRRAAISLESCINHSILPGMGIELGQASFLANE